MVLVGVAAQELKRTYETVAELAHKYQRIPDVHGEPK